MRTVAMRDSDSPQLDTVLTARATAAHFREMWPEMEQPDDLAAPGPVRVVRVQLSSGHTAAVAFHERRDFLEMLAPVATGIEVGLADVLIDLAIAPDAITWVHAAIADGVKSELCDAIGSKSERTWRSSARWGGGHTAASPRLRGWRSLAAAYPPAKPKKWPVHEIPADGTSAYIMDAP